MSYLSYTNGCPKKSVAHLWTGYFYKGRHMKEGREYFRFLAYSSGVFEGMDLMERALLDIIAQLDDKLTVSEAMSMGDIASGATIHRKLENLRKAGWITYEHQGEDRRTKYLTPTEKTLSEYIKLNFAVREAVNV
jgi:hypothetical protein